MNEMSEENFLNYSEEEIQFKIAEFFNSGNYNKIIQKSDLITRKFSNNADILNILALAFKNTGKSEEAKEIFLAIFELKPKKSYFYSNAGNLLFDMGMMKETEWAYKKALETQPGEMNALNGLSQVHRNLGNNNESLKVLRQAFKINPKDNLTNYNLGNYYRLTDKYKEAIKHYEISDRGLSKSHQLECIYRDNDDNKELFNKKLKALIKKNEVDALVGSLASHAAIRYSQEDEYTFCKNPMDFIEHSSLYTHENFNDNLIESIMIDVERAKLSNKKQSLIKNGFQSAGNLFTIESKNIQILKNIIETKIMEYRNKFSDTDADFIKKWPSRYKLYGWAIVLRSGGSLNSHMHKDGWLSGGIYFKIPKKKSKHEGDIRFGLDGTDYPTNNKEFPNQIEELKKGDIVMFPSSLMHSTIPFESDEGRITFAFDISPIF